MNPFVANLLRSDLSVIACLNGLSNPFIAKQYQ